MADLHVRWVSHYLAEVYLKNRTSCQIDLTECLTTVREGLLATPMAFAEPYPPEPARYLTMLKDIDFSVLPGKVVLLIALLDKERGHLLGDEATFALRTGDRRPGEHYASTAHVVINLTASDTGAYQALVEEAAGLSPSRISLALNWLLRKFCPYTLPSMGDTILVPTLKLTKLANVDLARDLALGELVMLALSRKPTVDELAASPATPPREILMKIGLPTSVTGEGAIASLRRLAGSTLINEFPTLHIGYKDQNGKNRSAVEELTPGQDSLTGLIHRKTQLPRFVTALPLDAPSAVWAIASAMADVLDNPS